MAAGKRKARKTALAVQTEDKASRTAATGYRLNFEPRTPNQTRVLKGISTHDLSFVIGPTGTGKTFLPRWPHCALFITGATRSIN